MTNLATIIISAPLPKANLTPLTSIIPKIMEATQDTEVLSGTASIQAMRPKGNSIFEIAQSIATSKYSDSNLLLI